MILEKIKKIRIEKGISHEAMAYNLGITQTAYTKIERNETKLSVERLYKIAENIRSRSIRLTWYRDTKGL